MRVSSAELPAHAIPHDALIEAPDTKQPILVTKTLRGLPLDLMMARKQITQEQYAAGDYMRAMFELFGTDGVRAVDFARPVIDKSNTGAVGVTDAQLRAGKRLRVAREFLGATKFKLLIEVVRNRKYIEDICRERGITEVRDKQFLARTFRECLAECSKLFLEASGVVPRRIGDSHQNISRSANKPELHRALTAALDAERLAKEAAAQTAGRVPVVRAKLRMPGEAA